MSMRLGSKVWISTSVKKLYCKFTGVDDVPALEEYLAVFLNPLKACMNYKPKLGTGKSMSVDDFQKLYGSDVFYEWIGLASPRMYAAHKAAGGITSLYRQVGVGCERLFRKILSEHFALTEEQAAWSYEIRTKGKTRWRYLDAKVTVSDVEDDKAKSCLLEWLARSAELVGANTVLKGAAFEVRQGYKSKDSKRQNADLEFASNAYSNDYLPVMVLFSRQIDNDVLERYRAANMCVLTGVLGTDDHSSTYAFAEKIVGFDLADFFRSNAKLIAKTMESVLDYLLK